MKNLIRSLLVLQLAWLNACSLLDRTKNNPGKAAVQSENQGELYTAYELQADAPAAPVIARHGRALPALRKGVSGAGIGLMGAVMAQAGYAEGSPQFNTESYDTINENTYHAVSREPLSTFSIDVDTASYANIRRMLNLGAFPVIDAVRVEEMINYFDYDDPAPSEGAFAVNMETAPALWNSKHQVVRINIKGKEIKTEQRPASSLVFLIDTSGSMDEPNKLPLVIESLKLLVGQLGAQDRIAIVVYAGSAGLVLPPTRGNQKDTILHALGGLSGGGSTNGGAGITLAYKLASENFIKGGVNRVILSTDGDFNVGITDRSGLLAIVEQNAKKNIYLSILGYGMGNYKDAMMQELTSKGNGNHAYIDTLNEAKKVLVEQMTGTLITIAKDVKIQVEFNPEYVESYRLVGYENRMLRSEDFNDDKKAAGDIGAGHNVTALYELVPKGTGTGTGSVDGLKYQKDIATDKALADPLVNGEWLTVKIRYKKPDGDVSMKIEKPLTFMKRSFESASANLRFASAVATFGMLLRGSEFLKEGDYALVKRIAQNSKGPDSHGYRSEFIGLVDSARQLAQHTSAAADTSER